MERSDEMHPLLSARFGRALDSIARLEVFPRSASDTALVDLRYPAHMRAMLLWSL